MRVMVWVVVRVVGNDGEVPSLYKKPATVPLCPNWLLSLSFPSRSLSCVVFCGAVFCVVFSCTVFFCTVFRCTVFRRAVFCLVVFC